MDQLTTTRLLQMALVGAVAAGVGWMVLRSTRTRPSGCSDYQLTPLDYLACQLEQVKNTAAMAHVELKEGWDSAVAKAGEDLKKRMDDFMQGLKEALLTEEMQEAVDNIAVLIDNLAKFDMDAVSYKNQFFILLALVRKVQHESDLPFLRTELVGAGMSDKQFQLAKRFGRFAINMYPVSWKSSNSAIATAMDVAEDDILMTWFRDDDQAHCPKFLLFLDHQTRSVVLAVRGTFCLKDVILDIVCGETPFLSGFAHEGILDGSRKILDKTRDLLEAALADHPGYRLVLTGHSLGAGTVELMTLELLLGPMSVIVPPGTQVSCVALAPPPVYRSNNSAMSGVLPASVTNAIEIYINNNDIVPRLSLATLAKLLAMLRAVDELGLSISQQFNILAGRSGEEVEEAMDRVRVAVNQVRQERFPFLAHPGRVYHLVRDRGEKVVVVGRQAASLFSEKICLFQDMVLDHLHGKYEEALEEAVLDLVRD